MARCHATSRFWLVCDQFVDLCILCGCDYCDTIRGIGPKTAVKLMQKHGSLEKVLENLDSKYTIPENFDFNQARELFLRHEVTDPATFNFKWGGMDEEKCVPPTSPCHLPHTHPLVSL